MKKDELQRLRELEAEVKAEFEVKEAQQREREEQERRAREERLRAAAAEEAKRKKALTRRKRDDDDGSALDAFRDRVGGTSGALDIAHQAKGELEGQRGEKSLLISGGLSMILGPLGWLYAGSWREAIPASLLYMLIGGLVSKILPSFLFLPILMVVLPVSGIAGMVYAWQYNKYGQRTRLFDKDDDDDD